MITLMWLLILLFSAISPSSHCLGVHRLFGFRPVPIVTLFLLFPFSGLVQSTDVVLEIGPGTGNLTAQLLKAAKKVRSARVVLLLSLSFFLALAWSGHVVCVGLLALSSSVV